MQQATIACPQHMAEGLAPCNARKRKAAMQMLQCGAWLKNGAQTIGEKEKGHPVWVPFRHGLVTDQSSLPMATAVSAMRLEKPHSLSYHARMRTMVPSSTLVWSMWNTDECGSWLKSLLTSGSSV